MLVVGFLTCNGSGMFCRPKLGYIGALDTRLISRLRHVEPCLQLHPIHTMHTMPIPEVPAYAHQPISHLPMVGAPLCAHHTPFSLTFCQFSHTQALPPMF